MQGLVSTLEKMVPLVDGGWMIYEHMQIHINSEPICTSQPHVEEVQWSDESDKHWTFTQETGVHILCEAKTLLGTLSYITLITVHNMSCLIMTLTISFTDVL